MAQRHAGVFFFWPMKHYLKLYWLFSTMSLRIALQHKTGVLFFLIGKGLRFGMFYFFIFTLLKNTKLFAGYTLAESMLFYITYNVIDTFTQLLFREVYRFRYLVASGELDGVLIKPYPPFLRVLFGGMDLMDAIILLPYLWLLSHYLLQVPELSFSKLVLFGLLIGNSLVIATAFHILVLALGVLTTEVDHTIMIYRDISKMAAFSIDIYREPLRSILTFVIPIGIMMSFPVKGLLGMLNWKVLTGSVVLGAGALFFALWVWDRALKKYQSWGS